MQNDDWSPPPDGFEIAPHQVDIWRISLDLPPAAVQLAWTPLSAEEAERAARFHFPIHRDRFVIAHAALRRILARYVRCEPYELNFATGEYGKPTLLPTDGIDFNLAHSGELALVAVAHGRRVGVDVELIRQNTDLEKIAHRYFSPREISELMALPEAQHTDGFFNGWTRKEAYIKAHGLGLAMPLDSFDVSLTPGESAILRATRPDPNEAERWTLFSLQVKSGYAAALAVEGKELEFRCWDSTLNPEGVK
jgi:4'-phosphopantetheinyl transferase